MPSCRGRSSGRPGSAAGPGCPRSWRRNRADPQYRPQCREQIAVAFDEDKPHGGDRSGVLRHRRGPPGICSTHQARSCSGPEQPAPQLGDGRAAIKCRWKSSVDDALPRHGLQVRPTASTPEALQDQQLSDGPSEKYQCTRTLRTRVPRSRVFEMDAADIHRLVEDAFNAGDVEALVALLQTDATMATPVGPSYRDSGHS